MVTQNKGQAYEGKKQKAKDAHVRLNESVKDNETNQCVLQGRTCIHERGNKRQLTLKDLTLHVVMDAGLDSEKDITCDLQFMIDSINGIGFTICHPFHWLPYGVPIYLYMDNAGGHGTDEIKKNMLVY